VAEIRSGEGGREQPARFEKGHNGGHCQRRWSLPAHTNRALEATIWLEENTGSKRRRRRTHLGNFLAQRGLSDGVELGVANSFDLQGSVTRGERIKARKEGKGHGGSTNSIRSSARCLQ
jgi:hypothetical protein